MPVKTNAETDRLIDELLEEAGSERNKNRGGRYPAFSVGLEEPIVWAKLFSVDIERYYTDPEYYVQQTIRQKLWAFRNIDDEAALDPALTAHLGHYPEYTYLGMTVGFDREGVPALSPHPLLNKCADISVLEPVEFGRTGWGRRQLDWHERICEITKGRVRVRFQTWWRGCLDLAVQMRGYDELMTDAAERPEFVHDLLGFITDERLKWYDAYCRHFNVPIPAASIGDDWLNVPFISPGFFAEFVLPQYKRLEAAQGSISSIHSCGNQTPLQKYMLELTTLRMFEVSPWTDLDGTIANLPPDKRLGIAMHPNDVLYLSGEEIEAKIYSIIKRCALHGRRIGIGTGGVTPVSETDAERDYLARIKKYTDAFRRAREKAAQEG